MFLGDNHSHQEIVSAYVFESEFDIIIDRKWLKETAPSPDWFNDTWELKDINNHIIKIHPIVSSKIENLHAAQTTKILPIAQANRDTEIDYLASASQVARWFKKEQISECFVVNFIDEDTENSATITPISPISAAALQLDKDWKEESAKLFPYAFKGEVTELPPHRHTRDIIVTDPKDAALIYHQPYRMSLIELSELKKQLNDLEKKGLFVPTVSPYGFPILFVQKAGSIRRMKHKN